MNLELVADILEQTTKEALSEKRYPFGMAKRRGLTDKVASGNLRNSIKAVILPEKNGETVISVLGPGGKMLSQTYGDFPNNSVQAGRVPGKKGVPIEALEKWIKDRGLQGRDKKGRYIKRRSFAFAIQMNIKKFGIKPSNFIDITLEKLENNQQLINALEGAAIEDLLNIIEGI